jgi:hypothetical protein
MNKIAASVGLLALGASCVHTSAQESYISGDPGKIWSVSASLRGFYDDNRNTAPDGAQKQSSFGYSVEPGFNINWERDQNTLVLSYKYNLMYYDRKIPNFRQYGQNHFFSAEFGHVFSERYQLKLNEAFSESQEPFLGSDSSAQITTPVSMPGNNYANNAAATFNAELTPVIGLEAGYRNGVYDYHLINLSAGLDRMEQSFNLDGRWNVLPETVAVLGYQYSMTDYSRPAGERKNNRAHYVYVGADQVFNPDLSGSVRVGGRLTDYYNDPLGSSTDTSPYARLGLTWTYAPESTLTAGFSYDRNATDISSLFGNNQVLDEQSATVYGTLRHRIVPNLFGSLNAQYQHSTVNSGDAATDGKTEQILLVGVNLQYVFNHYLSAEIGYDYDKVDSQLQRSYDRNRVYLGITGSY